MNKLLAIPSRAVTNCDSWGLRFAFVANGSLFPPWSIESSNDESAAKRFSASLARRDVSASERDVDLGGESIANKRERTPTRFARSSFDLAEDFPVTIVNGGFTNLGCATTKVKHGRPH